MHTPLVATLDGDIVQVSQPPLGVRPGLRPHFAEDRVLRLGPERPRDVQDSSPFGGGSQGLDASVGVGNPLDHAIPLEQVEAPRQGRLVDGESLLELPQVRLAQVREGREYAELGHPQAARPQDVVVQLGHGPRDHAKGAADTGRQPFGRLAGRPDGPASTHEVTLPAAALTGKELACTYMDG